jgi:hypothetical protein
MSAPLREMTDELYREEVRDARRMAVAEKLRLSGDLFDELCARMRDGVRFQFPDADDASVEMILSERLDIARRLEDGP